MSFNDGFSIKPIPFVQPLPGTASMLVSTPDGSGWMAEGIIENAISASVYVIETIETFGNIDGNGAPEDPVVLKDNISLTSVTASFNGDGKNVTNITASNISNFTSDVRGQLSAGQNINFSAGTISFTGTLPILNGGTGLTSSGTPGNILISNGSDLASQTLTQDVSLTSTGVATVKGLYTNPVRNPSVTTPVAGNFLKWGGTDWFPAPVSATVPIGSLQLTADPAQTITANGQTILPTSAYWRLNSAGNFNAGTINYVGAGIGQILFIQVPLDQAGSVTFNRTATLALGSNTRKVNAGGSLQLIYDGTHWIEMFFNTSTSL